MYLAEIVMDPILALFVVNQPRLVGITVFEMPDNQRQYIIVRGDQSKKHPVTAFLKPYKSFHSVLFTVDLMGHLGNGRNVFIAVVPRMPFTVLKNIQSIIKQVLENYRILRKKSLIVILVTDSACFFL